MDNIDIYSEKAIKMTIEYGPKLVLAIFFLIFGWALIRSITGFLRAGLDKKKVDPTLTPFLINIFSWGAKTLLIISVASMVGVETSSFIAVIGAAGLAIGLALQGSLANFAGGVIILVFRPFTKGDFIEAQSHKGKVDSIDIFATTIITVDNKRVTLPNGPLAGGSIDNYTAEDFRRVDMEIGISYNDDIREAMKVLTKMCEQNPKVLKEPKPRVVVLGYGDSSINLGVRPWVITPDYWEVFFEINEQIKYTLDENNITIPFPQRDLHVFKDMDKN